MPFLETEIIQYCVQQMKSLFKNDDEKIKQSFDSLICVSLYCRQDDSDLLQFLSEVSNISSPISLGKKFNSKVILTWMSFGGALTNQTIKVILQSPEMLLMLHQDKILKPLATAHHYLRVVKNTKDTIQGDSSITPALYGNTLFLLQCIVNADLKSAVPIETYYLACYILITKPRFALPDLLEKTINSMVSQKRPLH